MLSYNGTDFSEGIDVNKTREKKIAIFFLVKN